MMSTRQQLDSLAFVAIACFFVGITIGWTWYLQVVYRAAFLGFWTICGLSWWNRKHTHTEDAPPSMPDVIRESASNLADAERPDHHEITPESTSIGTMSERPDPTLVQFQLRRLVVHVVVFVVMVSALVLVAHLNVFVAAGAALTGNVLAIVLEAK
ncbi:MAG: hypothetical protein JO352_22365 [Chloroflexi bacterium]|nr:hypothetical protein [Chloroflexota bacterium]MBV9596388.1 hypothetical protein [Chloroflexota bacterium]